MSAPIHSTPGSVCDLVGAAVGSIDPDGAASIEDIDWLVTAGDYWVLAGWAGSGKNDLLATLSAMQRPLGGRFLVLGHDLFRLEAATMVDLRQRIGYVFGDGGRLFNDLTLAENIALPVAYHTNRDLGEVVPEQEALIALAELTEFAGLLPAQVGRAWRQRAALARALAMKPELLLLANPLSGFDRRHVRWWRECLARLNAGDSVLGLRPLTIIVTTEDVPSWAGHTKQFAVMRERRLIAYRSWQELAAGDKAFLREGMEDSELAQSAAALAGGPE